MTESETPAGVGSAGKLALNERRTIRAANAAMQFHIETAGGTSIDGWIPANTSIEIYNGGDITRCEITIPKQPSGLAPVADDGFVGGHGD